MSGFTATGATVLTDVDALGPDMLFWRQLTHWLGGLGIIVLALAVLLQGRPRARLYTLIGFAAASAVGCPGPSYGGETSTTSAPARRIPRSARDDATAARLWAEAERLTGVTVPAAARVHPVTYCDGNH